MEPQEVTDTPRAGDRVVTLTYQPLGTVASCDELTFVLQNEEGAFQRVRRTAVYNRYSDGTLVLVCDRSGLAQYLAGG